MANRLKMAIVQTIQRLHASGWSQRRIARELAIDRETVRRYVQCGETAAKPAISPAGSSGSKPATFSPSPGPSGDGCDGAGGTAREWDSKPAISPTGSGGANPAIFTSESGVADLAISPAGSVDEAGTSQPARLSLSGLAGDATGYDALPRASRSASGFQRGRPSHCAPHRAIILHKLQQQLSAQRIYQDLVSEHGFTGA